METRSRLVDDHGLNGGSALRASTPEVGARDEEWERLWLGVARFEWRSLALVPAAPRRGALKAAEALARAAARYGLRPIRLVDATQAGAADVAETLARIADAIDGRAQVMIAVASPLSSPAAIAIARAADAALLLAPLGEAGFADSRRAIESIGREHFLGSVALHPRT